MTSDKARRRIWFYHDGRHPHIYRYEPPMRREEYVACIDELGRSSLRGIVEADLGLYEHTVS